MKKISLFSIGLAILLTSCSNEDEGYTLKPEEGEALSGGTSTVLNASGEAFGFASQALTFDEDTDFGIGNSFFRQSWVSAPSSTTARDGLGPFYNAVSCSACHFKDGRGRPPAYDYEMGHGLLLRLGTAGTDVHGGPLADPVYGGQLQDNAILGQTAKGQFTITYEDITETYDDGTSVILKKPIYHLQNPGYGTFAAGIRISPRVANQIIGLGLLEAITETDILAHADANDTDGDGISGRANYVYDKASNTTKMGRFGWKANQPDVRQQVAAAFSGDMGLTSSLFPNENCPPGVDCNAIPNGGSPEVPDLTLERIVLYSRTLSVPARRNFDDKEVLEGKKIFTDLKCASCHTPKFQTGNDYMIAGLRNQTIRPYSDMLLHDMGANLSDGSPDFLASGSEWRTQPLWGIGLIATVNGHTNLMHDGRARNIEEAILWHGGEAQNAKNTYKKLPLKEREKLLKFLNSL